MTNDIVEAVRADLGYPPLVKADPNEQDSKPAAPATAQEKLSQAAIPAVLAGFYHFTRSDKGCNYILAGGGRSNWLDTLFGDKRTEAVEKIAQYAGVSGAEAETAMEDIAREAVILIHEAPGPQPTAEKLRAFMRSQRHHILVYLPQSLHFGDMLNDNVLDDQTNKMEGPISNLMHSIENRLSGGGS